MRHPDALIQVFCKTPQAGQVKTRLIPVLGQVGALSLYKDMVRHTLHMVDADLARVEIWRTQAGDTAFFDQFTFPQRVQQGAGLGVRMHDALQSGLDRYDRVVLIGADLPPVDAGYLATALKALEQHDVVLGPAEDGGYGLIGVRRQVPDVFSGIRWGTDTVLEDTCRQLNNLRLHYALLATIWDVDEPSELARYERWRQGSGETEIL